MTMLSASYWWNIIYKSRYILIGALICVVFYWLYLWHLGSLTPGLSQAETAARAHSQNWIDIRSNPVNSPVALLQFILQKAGERGAFWMRLPSVAIAIVMFYIFYRLLRSWFGRFSATLGILLFAATPLVILNVRSVLPTVLLLVPSLIITGFVLADKKDRVPLYAWSFLVLVVSLCFYIPGMIWILLLAGFFGRRRVFRLFKSLSLLQIFIGVILFLILLIPIVIAIYPQPSLLKQALLVPVALPDKVATLKSFGWSFLSYFWATPSHDPFNLGRLPLLNLLQLALSAFGIYVMWQKVRNKTYFLIATILVGYFAASLNRNVLFLLISLPALVVFMTAGLRYLYAEWLKRFPYNPLPRALAMSLMIGLITIHVMIGIRVALIAWPHTLATKNTYVLK